MGDARRSMCVGTYRGWLMPTGRGRDQIEPMERVIRLLLVLGNSESVATDTLLEAGAYRTQDVKSAKRMLGRDIEELNRLGWDIRNVETAGENGRYRLFARDNRLHVMLSPGQRAALVRAASDLGEPAITALLGFPSGTAGQTGSTKPPAALDRAVHAAVHRCRLRFTYKERPRVLHPYSVYPGPSGWYVRGHEEGMPDPVKEFVVDRMSSVSVDAPGSADAVPAVHHPRLDPLTWRIDPQTEVVLETLPSHRKRVEILLGTADRVTVGPDGLRMTYVVTHRAAFRWRVYELGTRVRVLGPTDVREEIIAELRSVVEGRSA